MVAKEAIEWGTAVYWQYYPMLKELPVMVTGVAADMVRKDVK